MCINLVNLSHKIKNLSSSEHSILNILAHRANENTKQCWPSVASIKESSSLDRKTILKCIQSLIEKKLIDKTGEMKGKTKSTPVYVLLLSGTNFGTGNKSSGPNFSSSGPKNGTSKQSQNWDMERSFLKDNKKDISLSKKITQEQKQEIAYYLANPQFVMREELRILIE